MTSMKQSQCGTWHTRGRGFKSCPALPLLRHHDFYVALSYLLLPWYSHLPYRLLDIRKCCG